MRPDTPREKWSARQLLDEIKRIEKRQATTESKREAELTAELERARAREAALLSEVAAARGEADAEGLAHDSVAGKPALSKYRRLYHDFANAVMALPDVTKKEGYRMARITVARRLDADLALFELDAPRGTIAARERDRLRRCLDSPAFLDTLANPSPFADLARSLFLSQVARAYFRPSVWRVYDKATDEGVMDRYGTVLK